MALSRVQKFFILFARLDAGLIRQITYTTARLGLFRVISDSMKTPDRKRCS